jgi:hypothetical protein
MQTSSSELALKECEANTLALETLVEEQKATIESLKAKGVASSDGNEVV